MNPKECFTAGVNQLKLNKDRNVNSNKRAKLIKGLTY